MQRRAVVFVDGTSERTITVFGEKRVPLGSDDLPWGELAGFDGVCFLSGDAGALEASRGASVVVGSARWLPELGVAGVELDALVGSGRDPAERYRPGDLRPEPLLTVITEGVAGGSYTERGRASRRFPSVSAPGPAVDAYGCGDSFVAALTYALAERRPAADAIAFAATCGAACLAGEALSGQLRLEGADQLPQSPA
jgi:ribokinase